MRISRVASLAVFVLTLPALALAEAPRTAAPPPPQTMHVAIAAPAPPPLAPRVSTPAQTSATPRGNAPAPSSQVRTGSPRPGSSTTSQAPKVEARSVKTSTANVTPVQEGSPLVSPFTAKTAPNTAAPSVATQPTVGPSNPIFAVDFPDPSVRNVGGKSNYMVGTGGSPEKGIFPIQRATGNKLGDFKEVGKVFEPGKAPAWVQKDFWAPEIHRVDGKWVVYYTARDQSGKLSLGAATSDKASGPYKDLGRPLLQDPRTGVIDSTHFKDSSGKHYLVWKLDGNDIGKPTPIYVQELAKNGLGLVGQPKEILTNDRHWEGINIEAPSVVHRDGYYYLFYSGNMYNTSKYAVGVARSTSPMGPYEKAPAPILESSEHWVGPGHGGPARVEGQDYFVYHAWPAGRVGDQRMVLADKLQWEDGWPKIGNGMPSGSPPPAPTPVSAPAAP